MNKTGGPLMCPNKWLALAFGLLFIFSSTWASAQRSPQTHQCDVVVAGGTTAALSAALTSAREGSKTCLLEPTDWLGGQITAGGVPAIDEAWHQVDGLNVSAIARDPRNMPAEWDDWLWRIGNPGRCWVSRYCFEPRAFHDAFLRPVAEAEPNLRVFYETMVRDVSTVARANSKLEVTAVTAVRRFPRPDATTHGGYDQWLSQDLADWYDPTPSAAFDKQTITLQGRSAGELVVIDATEFGDVLVLSGAPYLQGTERLDGSTEFFNTTCGQAFTFPIALRFNAYDQSQQYSTLPAENPQSYSLDGFEWDRIWSYRRLRSSETATQVGDVSVQNWTDGNDYGYSYLLLSVAEAKAQRDNWRGGVNLQSLERAENRAYGWFKFFRDREPFGMGNRISIAADVMGTRYGLSKLPYIRDTRRSVGMTNFVLAARHLQGHGSDLTGTRFADRVAIGAYPLDFHPMKNCAAPAYLGQIDERTLPFYIPYRALTNDRVLNLLVAGKTMAQSYAANAATRLQPIEWSTGIAAGAAASQMISSGNNDSRKVLAQMARLQQRIRQYAPLEWTINNVRYPQAGEALTPVPQRVFCPEGAKFDHGYGFCVDDQSAYGPFTQAMIAECHRRGGGGACSRQSSVTINGTTVELQRWGRQFAHTIRGQGVCPRGAVQSSYYRNHCVENYTNDQGTPVTDVFGPFSEDLVQRCMDAGGGSACLTMRWDGRFFNALINRG